MQLVFSSDPLRFSADLAKIAYSAFFLRDLALSWFSPHLDLSTGLSDFITYSEFFSALQAAFDDPDALGIAERDLWALKQETSCSAYYSKFVPLVSIFGWTSNTVKITYFCRGLKENLKDLLVGRDMPLNFSFYANKCISLDNDLFARQKEKKRI